jgi:hypothetical protein
VSTLLGVLQVVGKGGNELFVFDDAIVRAATGLGAALLGALDSSSTEGKEALRKAFAGQEQYADRGPLQIAQQARGNVLIWNRTVTSAVLSKGRWPAVGLRRLTLSLRTQQTYELSWPGNGATRPLNRDDYAVSLLSKAFPDVLDVRLTT